MNPRQNFIRLSIAGICSFTNITALADPPVLAPPPSPPAPTAYSYYCASERSYYPYVTACPEGWVATPMELPMVIRDAEPVPDEPGFTVLDKPNVASIEFFGRALLYSGNLDHAFSERVSIGAGISYWSNVEWWRNLHSNVVVVPAYLNYYLSPKRKRGFVTAGADWIHVSDSGYSDDTFANTGVAAVLGAGYEERDRSGFLFRVAGYLIAGRTVTLNPAASIGFVF